MADDLTETAGKADGVEMPPMPRNRQWNDGKPLPPPIQSSAQAFPPAPSSAQPGAGATSARLSLPQRVRSISQGGLIWFGLSVAAPIAVSALYFGLIASNQYVSEFRFTVRQPVTNDGASNVQDNLGNLTAVLGNVTSFAGAVSSVDNYTAVDYIRSGQAVSDISHDVKLRDFYSRKEIDPFSRLPANTSTETLNAYWQHMVRATYDPATGLASVKVRAFKPADAYAIAQSLINSTSTMVNTIGHRSREDDLKVAQAQVDRAQRRIDEVRAQIRALRQRVGQIDPKAAEIAQSDTLATDLRNQLAASSAQLAYLNGQLRNPQAPQIVQLKARMAAMQSQLVQLDAQVGKGARGGEPLAQSVAEFEALQSQLKQADDMLFGALAGLQRAGEQSDAQRLYVTTYVSPALPESSTYPDRLGSVLLTALVSLMVWLIGVLLGKSIMEHGR